MTNTKSALMKWTAKSLIRLVPGGEAALDFATDVVPAMSRDVYGWWTGNTSAQERREDLEALAQADAAETKAVTDQAIDDALAESDETITPEKREKVRQYLLQVPDAIRRSMRRPEDSKGLTVPPHLAPRSPEQLAALLPQQPPRYKTGDHPIAGVDIELVSTLGAGGFGEVWRARKTHLGQDVALKFCLDPSASASLRNETALLRRLMSDDAAHPGIVKLHATYNDCTALEYEFVEGGDLAGVIKQWHADGKKPSPKEVVEAIIQISDIVAFAHQLEPPLVHRDLKPANILVQRKKDGSLRFRLTDFGIGGIAAAQQVAATQRGNASASSTTSLHGSYSFLYASPQQMRAEQPDPTDDVYSLGVIFWQLVSGDLADGAPGGMAWMSDMTSAGYSQAAVELLASCFDRRADRRPKNAAVFTERLRQSTPHAPPPMPTPLKPLPPMQPLKPMSAMPPMAPTAPATPQNRASPVSPAIRAAEVRTSTHPTPAPLPPSQPAPLRPTPGGSSTKVWIFVGIGIVALIGFCIVSSIIIYAMEEAGVINTDPDIGPRSGAVSPAAESVVITLNTQTGPAEVVETEDGTLFLKRRDGTRSQVTYNEFAGRWEYVNAPNAGQPVR